MGVSPLQEAGAAEGPDDGDAAEAAPPGVDAGGATDATGPDTAPSVADSGSDAGSAIEAGPEAGIAGDGGRTIFGNWIYTNAANTQGYVLSLKSDDTYVLQRFVRTSATAANDEVETGSMPVAAHTIAFVPAQWSCRATDPPYTTPYALTDPYLDVTYTVGLIAFHVDTAPSDFVPTVGCFAKSGAFTLSPLAPVTP
jgi:hypothetical protein